MRILSFTFFTTLCTLMCAVVSPTWAIEVETKRISPLLRKSRNNPNSLNIEEVRMENSHFWKRMLLQSMSSSSAFGDVKMASSVSPKAQWPECIDDKLKCDECKSLVAKESYPNITNVEILGEHDPATYDLRNDRVRIFCNKETNKVVVVPYIG